jgi:hypothetical protein
VSCRLSFLPQQKTFFDAVITHAAERPAVMEVASVIDAAERTGVATDRDRLSSVASWPTVFAPQQKGRPPRSAQAKPSPSANAPGWKLPPSSNTTGAGVDDPSAGPASPRPSSPKTFEPQH